MSPDEIWGRTEDSDRRSDSQENDSRPLITLRQSRKRLPAPYHSPTVKKTTPGPLSLS